MLEDAAWDFSFNRDASIHRDVAEDTADSIEVGNPCAIRVASLELHDNFGGIERKPALHRRNQIVASFTGDGRHTERARMKRPNAIAFGIRDGVALVEDLHRWHPLGANLSEHRMNRG